MRQLETLCPQCGQPLTEIDFSRTHYMHLCLNWQCPIRRQPQSSREKNVGFGPIIEFIPSPSPNNPIPFKKKRKIKKKMKIKNKIKRNV